MSVFASARKFTANRRAVRASNKRALPARRQEKNYGPAMLALGSFLSLTNCLCLVPFALCLLLLDSLLYWYSPAFFSSSQTRSLVDEPWSITVLVKGERTEFTAIGPQYVRENQARTESSLCVYAERYGSGGVSAPIQDRCRSVSFFCVENEGSRDCDYAESAVRKRKKKRDAGAEEQNLFFQEMESFCCQVVVDGSGR